MTAATDEPTPLLVAALRNLDLAIDRVRSSFARRYRITINDSLVVSHLSANERRMRPSELAARILVTSGTLTPMLDRLEAAGFVRREPNPGDRRSVHVVLTDEGERAAVEYQEHFHAAIQDIVPRELRYKLAECLTDLSEALGEFATRIDDARADQPVL